MRIVYHLGAHCTDDERLLKCLLKNQEVLGQQGIVVPAPSRYRNLIRDTAISLKGKPASPDTQATVLDQIMDADQAARLILSWDCFLAFPQWALRQTLYPTGADRLRAITQIFPEIEAEFHLAIRNPATFLPELFKRQRGKTYEEFMDGTSPISIRWSELIARIVEKNPGVPLFVWCDEDTPLIWPEVLRSVSGHNAETKLTDADELLKSIMTEDGFRRMNGYLDAHPPQNEMQRRRVVTAFLDKFVRPDQIEVELDMPDWTDELIAAMSLQYDQDVAYIAQMPGVTFIAP